MKRFLAAIAVLAALIMVPSPGLAEDGGLPSVEPEACVTEPLVDLPVVPSDDLNDPTPTPPPILTSDAVPADDDVSVDVTDRIAQSIACYNAGDLPRMIASFSTRWISERFSGYDLIFMLRYLEAAESPRPVAEVERIELIAIEDIQIRAEDEAIATVVTRQGGIEQRSLLALVLEEDAWVIDRAEIIVTD